MQTPDGPYSSDLAELAHAMETAAQASDAAHAAWLAASEARRLAHIACRAIPEKHVYRYTLAGTEQILIPKRPKFSAERYAGRLLLGHELHPPLDHTPLRNYMPTFLPKRPMPSTRRLFAQTAPIVTIGLHLDDIRSGRLQVISRNDARELLTNDQVFDPRDIIFDIDE